MDAEILARLQFALTIMFHYIYPPFSIGLGVVLVISEGLYMKTRSPEHLALAKFWTKIFALTFAIGVATGIVMVFEFGTNWATYSRYVGDVFGSALAAEGIFAFFLESGFLALLLFGWDRISPKLHYFSTWMVAFGAHFSAIWITVANSWMQTPAGFTIVGEDMWARAQVTNFWEMVLNPSTPARLSHVILGCWLQGAFLVLSISAYYLIKKRHQEFAKTSMKIALSIAAVATILQGFAGDSSGEVIAKHQPLKLAALEGLYQTQEGAPLALFGISNPAEEKIDYRVAIPKLLSFLAFGNVDAKVQGLKEFNKKDWPNTTLLFFLFRVMIWMWIFMLLVSAAGLYKWWRGTLEKGPIFLWSAVFGVLAPLVANQTGWVCAEMGRYPWIVYNQLRISDGLSKTVSANQILSSIIMFTIIYIFLLAMFIYLLDRKIKHGPVEGDDDMNYHHLQDYAERVSKLEISTKTQGDRP